MLLDRDLSQCIPSRRSTCRWHYPDHVILGVQAVGTHVAELHAEFILALEMGALLEDVAGTVHAHPTMSEAFHESVLKTLGRAIHIS